MEDYKKKYEKIIEKVKNILNKSKENGIYIIQIKDIEDAIPELKESEDEDEKIRNRIIDLVNARANCNDVEPMIAWLEKQGEQKPTDKVKPKFHEGEWVVFNDKHESVYQIEKIENFQYTLRHVLGGSMPLSFGHEDMIRAWTIADAKDRDVLATKDAVFIFKHIDKTGLSLCKSYCEVIGNSELGLGFDFSINGVYPATKEQRDQLEKAMANAGYTFTFDFEKKELKKIEQKPAETEKGAKGNDREIPNCTWSEEDESMLNFVKVVLSKHQNDEFFDKFETTLNDCLSWFKDIKSRVGCEADCTTTKEWSEEGENIISDAEAWLDTLCDYLKDSSPEFIPNVRVVISKLKSLRPQNRWKPSDEQMEALRIAIGDEQGSDCCDILRSLLKDLKSL